MRWANLEGRCAADGARRRDQSTCSAKARRRSATRSPSPASWARSRTSLAAFRTQLVLALALAGVGLLAVTLFQIRFGLFPLPRSSRASPPSAPGEATRLDGDLPHEIEPLQQELNALLKSNQEIVERARTHVGNLAHALKTPLAVIINEARDDPSPFARKVIEQAELMTTQVNLYLDRARMAARIGVIGRVTEVRPVGESIIRALERIYRDRHLDLHHRLPRRRPLPGRAPGPRGDAGQPARQRRPSGRIAREPVAAPQARRAATAPPATGSRSASTTTAPASRRAADGASPSLRGRRLDETKPGSGLGHSIVADLAHAYSGKFELSPSDLGGLSARLTLPLAALDSPHIPFNTDDALTHRLAGANSRAVRLYATGSVKLPSHVRHPMCTNRRQEPYFRPNRGNTRGL